MIQFFWNRRTAPAGATRETWCDDILRHPAIERMDERQRGDLPLPRPDLCAGDECQRNGDFLGGRAGTSM